MLDEIAPVVNVAAVEFRFGAVAPIQKLLFNISYKKIGIARSLRVSITTLLICL